MARRRKREVEPMGLAFLDVVCCGFGAVLLLLVITKVHQPVAVEASQLAFAQRIEDAEQKRLEAAQRSIETEQRINELASELEQEDAEFERLRAQVEALSRAREQNEQRASVQQSIEQRLKIAQQELSREMQRLALRDSGKVIGGVPVDSEYIIFIIDTSGSMQHYNWNRVLEKVEQTLDAYPTVKGIQVMNDMGRYLFSGYAREWIPDTPSRRKVILSRMRRWRAFSNSSPAEGVAEAIRTFYAPDKRISLYVFGDEFSGGSIASVVRQIDRINLEDEEGRRRVRIHGIGFPIPVEEGQPTSERFAALMRELCQRNGGTFVAIAN